MGLGTRYRVSVDCSLIGRLSGKIPVNGFQPMRIFAAKIMITVVVWSVGVDWAQGEPGITILDDGLSMRCVQAPAGRRSQVRVFVPTHLNRDPFGPEHAKILAFRAAKSIDCGGMLLVAFYADREALIGWDGTGLIQAHEEALYLGRVRVDHGKPVTWMPSPF